MYFLSDCCPLTCYCCHWLLSLWLLLVVLLVVVVAATAVAAAAAVVAVADVVAVYIVYAPFGCAIRGYLWPATASARVPFEVRHSHTHTQSHAHTVTQTHTVTRTVRRQTHVWLEKIYMNIS